MTKQEQLGLYKLLGLNIKEARLQKGYKQDAFADILKLSRASIVNIEKGRQRPTLHLLYEICKVTDLDLNDLLPRLSFKEELTLDWQEKVQEKVQEHPRSTENLSNFLRQVTTKANQNDH